MSFFKGLKDALSLWFISIIYKNRKLQSTLLQIVLLNGVLYLGSIVGFDWINFDSNPLASFIFNWLWVYPMCGLCFLVNSFYYQEIANEEIPKSNGKTL